jgi:hypothetical protein
MKPNESRYGSKTLRLVPLALGLLATNPEGRAEPPIAIGGRRELFVDSLLVEKLTGGAELRLHHPTPQEVVLVADRPWEGNGGNYMTVFRDGDRYRMYYRGVHVVYRQGGYDEPHAEYTCYAESADGIRWTRPSLGLFEVMGTRSNNVVMTREAGGNATHNFCPFIDTRPGVSPEERYKALGGGGEGLTAFASGDGLRWRKLHAAPVITKGAFDSQNLAFWDAEAGEYRAYFRDFRDGRDIKTCTSQDFIHWTDPVYLEYTPGRISELYTNQINPYHRAPHLLLGFPTRYLDRGWTAAARNLPQLDYRQIRASQSTREGTALTDGMFMASRDRKRFTVWPESFIRPGLRTSGNWFYGDNYQCLGLLETKSAIAGAPDELSFFVTEATLQGDSMRWRRYTLRPDGFVSVRAPLAGGELVTRPLTFAGDMLELNYSTSAAGGLRIEIQDPAGAPLPGFALAEAEELYGDSLAQPALWKPGSRLSGLAGKPVRLRFVLRDADLYSYQFRPLTPH